MNDDPDRVLDGYLVVLAQGGSREAFDRLTRRWTPRLVRYTARAVGHPELSHDIAQETWIGAIRGFFSQSDLRSMLLWGAGAMISALGLGLIKLYFFMEIQKNTIIREIKRVELQVAGLTAALRDGEADVAKSRT